MRVKITAVIGECWYPGTSTRYMVHTKEVYQVITRASTVPLYQYHVTRSTYLDIMLFYYVVLATWKYYSTSFSNILPAYYKYFLSADSDS
jgi:hypothetical protein